MHDLLELFRSLTKNLDQFTAAHGNTTYAILMAIVFVETGFVIMPFLPGDSLLFAAGAVCSRDAGLSFGPLALGLVCAAFAGDNINYHVGKAIGPRVMRGEKSRLFNKKHLDKTKRFFEKYGGKTVILARFVPIVRTFAPFVAGAGAMNYRKFVVYSIGGACLWVGTMMGAGYVLGQIQFVKDRFELIVVGIVIVSVMPMVVEYWKSRGKPSEDEAAVAEANAKSKADDDDAKPAKKTAKAKA